MLYPPTTSGDSLRRVRVNKCRKINYYFRSFLFVVCFYSTQQSFHKKPVTLSRLT